MSETMETANQIERLRYALFTILANTEEDAIKHIAYDGMTAYEALAKDIADCARSALAKSDLPSLFKGIRDTTQERKP